MICKYVHVDTHSYMTNNSIPNNSIKHKSTNVNVSKYFYIWFTIQ